MSVEINITVIINFDRTLLIAVGLYRSASANASLASTMADEHNVAAVLRLSGRVVLWSRSPDVNLPHLYLAPPLGMMSLEFRQDFWQRKTRVLGLFYAILSVILGLAIFVQLRLVTDRQKDGRTDRQTRDDS